MNGAKVSGKGGISMDFSQVEKNLKKLIKDTTPPVAGKGLFNAGCELIRDGIEKAPGAPKRTGALWGSGQVEDKKISDKSGKITPAQPSYTKTKDSIGVIAGFNIDYAAKLHELPQGKNINWTTDKGAHNPGPKFLELKMSMYKKKYMEIIALTIKNMLNK